MSPSSLFTLLIAAASALATPLSTNYNVPRIPLKGVSFAPVHVPNVEPHNLIKDSYMVRFKDDVHPSVFDAHFNVLDDVHREFPLLDELESGLIHVWNSHIKGYAGKFSREVVDYIRTLPEVDYIEQDQVVYALDTQKQAPWVCFLVIDGVAQALTRLGCNRGLRVSATAIR